MKDDGGDSSKAGAGTDAKRSENSAVAKADEVDRGKKKEFDWWFLIKILIVIVIIFLLILIALSNLKNAR